MSWLNAVKQGTRWQVKRPLSDVAASVSDGGHVVLETKVEATSTGQAAVIRSFQDMLSES